MTNRRWSRRGFLAAAGAATAAGLVDTAAASEREGTAALTRTERDTLRALADEIVPAGHGMPAASEAGAVGYVEALAVRDEHVRGQLREITKAVDGGARARHRRPFARLAGRPRVEVLAELERTAPDTFTTARNLIYEGYYAQAAVTRRLGFDFVPLDREAPPLEAFDERLVESVVRRGRRYRQLG